MDLETIMEKCKDTTHRALFTVYWLPHMVTQRVTAKYYDIRGIDYSWQWDGPFCIPYVKRYDDSANRNS